MFYMKKDPILVELGRRVSALRETKELTQEQLAERARLDPSYISGIERGVRNPSYLSLVRLANGFGIPVAEVCNGLSANLDQRAEN